MRIRAKCTADGEVSLNATSKQLGDTLGIESVAAEALSLQILQIVGPKKFPSAISLLIGLNPQDAGEAMLAAQLVASHTLAMDFSARLSGMGVGIPEFARVADRALRTAAHLAEVLDRRRRGPTSQRIVVERVDVRDGGQAVVGSVDVGGGRKETDVEAPHEP
jgi:hypothetical protein